jgi:DNA repair photolyase
MDENLNELIKTDNATILTFEKVKHPKPVKTKIIKPKPVFGTKEWADRIENCLDGCSHDCKYCYAKVTAVRFGQ